MNLSVLLTNPSTTNLRLVRQAGATEIVLTCPQNTDDPTLKLTEQVRECRKQGLNVNVVERFLPHEKIVLGLEGRETQMLYIKRLIECMGKLKIGVLCYNWMPSSDWTRTRIDVKERGGALVTEFDESELKRTKLHGKLSGQKIISDKICSAKDLWSTLESFLKEILPIAEKNNVVLALHPDDPPLPILNGKPQILYSVKQLERVLSLSKSPSNGICFCQGTFASAGEDIPKAIRTLGKAIKFVHFRDVVVHTPGSKFREAWQDTGDTNMLEAIRAYHSIGFRGTIRPDHVPTCETEDNTNPGYHILGRLWALGYIRGLMESVY